MKVAIIGAGPAGCTLAHILINASVPVTVFENHPEPRPDGGTLDLHTETGLAAVKKAGLYDEFLKHARFDGESFQVVDKRCVHLLNTGGASESTSRGRPEIDRPALVHMLADTLPKGTIRFNHKLLRVADDRTLHFEHGSESGFDLVVGADGAWSRTRKALSDVDPYFTGVVGYEGNIPNAAEQMPELSTLVRRGSVFGFSDCKSIMAQQMGNGSIKSSAWLVQREPKGLTGDAAREHICDVYKGWSPRLLEALDSPKVASISFRALYMLPIGFRWVHKAGITLIGDAAHLMTPFAGEGVNAAMQDAMILADHIIAVAGASDGEKEEALSRRIKQAEDDMFDRALNFTNRTWTMTTAVFFDDGMPWSSFGNYMLAALSDECPGWLWPVVVPTVHTYVWWIRYMRGPKST